MKLFDSAECFGLVAAVVGVKIKGLFRVVVVISLAGFEEDVVFIIAGGDGEVWVDGGIGEVGGWDVGHGGRCGREDGKGSMGCYVDG